MKKDLITSYIGYKSNLNPDILIIHKKTQQSSQKYCLDIFKNKGYGTKEHLSVIKKIGITNLHRKSFLKKSNLI